MLTLATSPRLPTIMIYQTLVPCCEQKGSWYIIWPHTVEDYHHELINQRMKYNVLIT